MTATEYESIPAVERDAERAPAGIVVMKFGGTSVATPEKLKSMRSVIHFELIGVVLIMLMAALMAKGVGV